MTKGAALQAFFSRFMDAYASNAVPEDVTFPYLTYDAVFDAWGGAPVSMTVNMWFYTTGEAVPNAKVQELSEALGIGGATIQCDDGYIWLLRGSPWCQSLADETDRNIKRRYVNYCCEQLVLTCCRLTKHAKTPVFICDICPRFLLCVKLCAKRAPIRAPKMRGE